MTRAPHGCTKHGTRCGFIESASGAGCCRGGRVLGVKDTGHRGSRPLGSLREPRWTSELSFEVVLRRRLVSAAVPPSCEGDRNSASPKCGAGVHMRQQVRTAGTLEPQGMVRAGCAGGARGRLTRAHPAHCWAPRLRWSSRGEVEPGGIRCRRARFTLLPDHEGSHQEPRKIQARWAS